MYRQHGQKRQKCTGEHHTEHIAEIGTGGHLYVSGDIAKGLTPFQDTLFEHTQIFVQKNDIGTLLRNVHGRIYGNTNVRLPQCSGIIHPVTQKSYRVAILLKNHDYLALLQRRQPGKESGLSHYFT